MNQVLPGMAGGGWNLAKNVYSIRYLCRYQEGEQRATTTLGVPQFFGMECVEITNAPELNDFQSDLLDKHSVLNVLNVLMGEIQLLGLEISGNARALQRSYEVCDLFIERLTGGGVPMPLDEALKTIGDEVGAAEEGTIEDSDAGRSIATIRGVLPIFASRYRELLDPMHFAWSAVDTAQIRREFSDVMAAMAAQAKGRYGFASCRQKQGSSDYLVRMCIEAGDATQISIPRVLIDAVRDLFANSRKYTQPGGTIEVALLQLPSELHCCVDDSGCGIPAGELSKVAHFGYRASNVLARRTNGGGFGLTKAVVNIKRFNGRIWIGSELGRGTCVTFRVPLPALPKIAWQPGNPQGVGVMA